MKINCAQPPATGRPTGRMMKLRFAQNRLRTWLAALAVLVTAVSARAVTNDFYLTTRTFPAGRIDLKPLVKWLRTQSTDAGAGTVERPLPAWKVVRIERIIST